MQRCKGFLCMLLARFIWCIKPASWYSSEQVTNKIVYM